MSVQREVVEVSTPQDLAGEAARRFVTLGRQAIAQRGSFSVALSGGSTPGAMYAHLAAPPLRDQLDWTKAHIFFSDERFVPPDSPESNFHAAQQGLLAHVPAAGDQVHAYRTVDISPQDSATEYETCIRTIVGTDGGTIPVFDLILLGLGPDGHTASLFPDTDALSVVHQLVAPNFVSKLDAWRLTFTYPLLNAGRTVLFLVQGVDKKERVREVLGGHSSLPAARVLPATGSLIWLLDSAAAAEYDADSPHERTADAPA